MQTVTLIKNMPASNPDSVLLKIVQSGNYVTNATGDALNLTPSAILDPGVLGVLGPQAGGNWKAVGVFEEAMGGYYAQVQPGAAINTWAVKYYAPGGAELASIAYPAAITGGTLILEAVL